MDGDCLGTGGDPASHRRGRDFSIPGWVVAQAGNHWAVSASGFRAFREPTPNELYRSTQVGNELTTPNGNLLSERATGWETGLADEDDGAACGRATF